MQIAHAYCIIFTIDYLGVTLMKKNKFILTVLVFALALCMLVACGEKPQAPNGNQQGGSQTSTYFAYNLNDMFAGYANGANFKVDCDVYVSDMQNVNYTDHYEIDGNNVRFKYEDEGETMVDYISVNEKGEYFYYADNGDGTYEKLDKSDKWFDVFMGAIMEFDIGALAKATFKSVLEGAPTAQEVTDKYNKYQVENPQSVATDFFGAMEGETFKSFTVECKNGEIGKITIESEAEYEGEQYPYKYELTIYGKGTVSIDLNELVIGGGSAETTTYKAEFTDDLFANNSGISFSANKAANDFANGRGVQFLQKNGEVEITTSTTLTSVTKVTLVVQSNAINGMNVSVSVGTTKFTSGGLDKVKVEKCSNFDVLTTVVFGTTSGVDGVLKITLSPTGTKSSMYILSVEIECGGTGGDTPAPTPTETMPSQQYDPAKVDKSTLREQMKRYFEKERIGDPLPIPSTGAYSLLVIPVQFSDKPISDEQMDRLGKAFNGTSEDTGWESVNSYYKKSSYGKLDMTFDVQKPFVTDKNYKYYEDYSGKITVDGETITKTGDILLLELALAYYAQSLDLTKYDTDNDGIIDAVYLIYSAPVTYDSEANADSIYWAYVTTYPTETQKYDGLEVGYYLFAGFDFMDEHTGNSNDTYLGQDGYTPYKGLKIMAETYIHETGHLLGLDDYYDYEDAKGSGEGLGGADMMDYNVGDHNAYSKLILGWVDPTVITTTQTVTINAFESSGQFLMVLLDYDGTYFSEYLLIDLYANTGLNFLGASQQNSLLYYDLTTKVGAEYGVRIYHISSSIKTPYNDDYGSFTDNNNSVSDTALIKLVEADGEKKFASTEGYAESTDLWMAGDSLLSAFSNYARNDNKKVNFDIRINSVSKTSATITITFAA